MLTTFDATFDFTFGRADVLTPEPLPPVGGELSTNATTGVHLAGSVLPFSTDPSLLPSCRNNTGQAWERWTGSVGMLPGYVMPFMLAVPKPIEIVSSLYCNGSLLILNADTGATILITSVVLYRLTDANTLYIICPGGALTGANQAGVVLPEGAYRFQVGPSVSDVFVVRPAACGLRVRLSNLTRLGNLLYGTQGFEQQFYLDGELTGPTYEEAETKSGDVKSAGTVTKTFTLSLSDVPESVADALALASLHRIVEVGVPGAGGGLTRIIQAMPYQASAKVSQGSGSGFDVSLSLPVSVTTWAAPGSVVGCLVDVEGGALLPVNCGIPGGGVA